MHIELTSMNAHLRRPCLTCGGQLDSDAIAGQVFENDRATGRDICAWCLSHPVEVIADMRQRVRGYRAAAAQLGESPFHFSTCPTLDEFKRAMETASESYWQLVRGGSHSLEAVQLRPADTRLIAGFEVVIKNVAGGDGHTDTVVKIKLTDRAKYVQMAAQHFALLTDVVRVEADAERIQLLFAGRARCPCQ
jgi:hypothetical protein